MDIKKFLADDEKKDLLRLSTMGSVDDGKSTLIGRLLFDSKNIYEDQLASIRNKGAVTEESGGEFDLANLMDGLKAEREQGITIDVAYRYFSTPKRRFIVADTPGHEQYTRNMVTGASTANLAIILIDARQGVLTQTKRHAFIASLLNIKHVVVAINKMDAVDYKEEIYNSIKEEFISFSAKMNIPDIRFIPMSALKGDNVVKRNSENTPWYKGESLFDVLENVVISSDINFVDTRLPVQYVLRPNQDYRGFCGQLSSGVFKVGDEISAIPSMKKAIISGLKCAGEDVSEVFAPMSITIELDREIDISRGDMIVRSKNVPTVSNKFEAMLTWMSEEKFDKTRPLFIKHSTRTTRAKIEEITYAVDINTLHQEKTDILGLNDIARVSLSSQVPLIYDIYSKNKTTGSFILVDSLNNLTVAAGMIIERKGRTKHQENDTYKKNVNSNLHQVSSLVTREERENLINQSAHTLWMTGLSGSGKSTVSKNLERSIHEQGKLVQVLDGDNIRSGLNSDLGFSAEDRSENIRRIAEVSKLLNDSGIIVIASFISPFESDRELAKLIIGEKSFSEVFIKASIDACEDRDPKGLYKKVRSGEILNFTGISSDYQVPEFPDLVLDTENQSIEQSVSSLEKFLQEKKVL